MAHIEVDDGVYFNLFDPLWGVDEKGQYFPMLALADLLKSTGREGTYETAVRYQMYHALGLLAVAWLAQQYPSPWLNWAGWLMLAGVLIFSGSLYLLVFTGVRWMGAITPLRGAAFLAPFGNTMCHTFDRCGAAWRIATLAIGLRAQELRGGRSGDRWRRQERRSALRRRGASTPRAPARGR